MSNGINEMPSHHRPYGSGRTLDVPISVPYESKIVDNTCIVTIPDSEGSIAIPADLSSNSPEKRNKQFAELLKQLHSSRIERRPPPKKLIVQGENPLLNEKYLLQSLNPPKALREGTVIEEAETARQERARNLIRQSGNTRRLELNVGPLGGVKIPDAFLGNANNAPDLGEQLFLSRAFELADTLSGFPTGVTVNIAMDPGAEWLLQDFVPKRDLVKAESQYSAALAELATRIGTSINPDIQIAFTTNEGNGELIERYDEMYRLLQTCMTKWFPKLAEEAVRLGISTYGENSSPELLKEFLLNNVYRDIPRLQQAGLNIFTQADLFYNHLGNVVSNNGKQVKNDLSIAGMIYPISRSRNELYTRYIAQLLVHNELTLQGRENDLGLSPNAVSHVIPMDTWYVQKKAVQHAGFPLALLKEIRGAVENIGTIPNWTTSYIAYDVGGLRSDFNFTTSKRYLMEGPTQEVTVNLHGVESTIPMTMGISY